MKTRLLTFLVVLVTLACFATPPSGTHTFDFTPAGGAGIWDVSGDYVITQRIVTLDVTLSFTLSQDARGRLSGTGTAAFNDGAEMFSGPVQVTGNIRGVPGATAVSLVASLSNDSESPAFSGKVRLPLTLNPLDRTLAGMMSGTLKRSSSRIRFSGPVTTALPDSATGNWSVSVLVGIGRRYRPDDDRNDEYVGYGYRMSGDAVVTLGSGRTFHFGGGGLYSENGIFHFRTHWDEWGGDITGGEMVGPRETKLNLRGTSDAGGSKLMLHGYGLQFDLLHARARIAGQRVSGP